MKKDVAVYLFNPASKPMMVANPGMIESVKLTTNGVLITTAKDGREMHTYESAEVGGTVESTGKPFKYLLQPLMLEALDKENITVETVKE